MVECTFVWGVPLMDVILDSNRILADPRLKGNHFSELFIYLRRTNSSWVVPAIVFHEATAKYARELHSRAERARSAWRQMWHFSMEQEEPFPDIDVANELRNFKRRIVRPAPRVRVSLY